MLEKLALEYQWRCQHGRIGIPDEDPEQCIRVIMYHLGGVMRRYRGRLSEAVLMDLLRKSCLSYANGTRRIGLIDTFIETLNAYIKQHDNKLPKRNRRSDRVLAEAYKGNGFESFTLRNNTSVPEVLALSAYIPQPPHEQTDAEISADIDAILGVESGGDGEQGHD